MPEQESPAAGKSNLVLGDGIVSQGVVIGSARNESSTSDGAKGAKEVVLVEEVDMIQVGARLDSMLCCEGIGEVVSCALVDLTVCSLSSAGRQLWTVCNSPECGMYMFGGWKGGSQPPFLGPGFDGAVHEFMFCVSEASLQSDSPARIGRALVGINVESTMKRPTFQEDDKPLPPIILYGNITSANCGINMTMNATSMNFEVRRRLLLPCKFLTVRAGVLLESNALHPHGDSSFVHASFAPGSPD
eukprot:768814-Hanusia_phi.AAC.12